MIKFFLFARQGLFFFKQIRVGIYIVIHTFKTLIFEHKKYYIFCFILMFFKASSFWLNNYIETTVPSILRLTDYIAGQNFFEIMLNYHKYPLTMHKLFLIVCKTAIFFINLVLSWITYVAAARYFQEDISGTKISLMQSFLMSFKKLKIISLWSLIELFILFAVALLGIIGNLFYLFWDLATSFTVQLIAFRHENVFSIFQKSIQNFQHRFANILGIEFLINVALIILTAIFYSVYKTETKATIGALSLLENPFIILFIFYLMAFISIAQIMAMTSLYLVYFRKTMPLKPFEK
jgi:hypothetical protein